MAQLNVKLNYSEKTAVFWGPGTFDAKDTIKTLGLARWNPASKAWEVKGFKLPFAELKALFPDLHLEEMVGDNAPENADEKAVSSSSPSSAKSSTLPASISVSEFSLQIRRALKQAFPHRIFIHGVISSIKRAAGGRAYLDIAEKDRPDEIVRCVIWRDIDLLSRDLKKAGFELEANLEVMFEAEVDLNPKWSSISLKIVGIVAEYTLAKLKAQRELTNDRLKKEGLFSKNKSKTLPFLPKRLGIITSGTGTVIFDFKNAIDEGKFGFELIWRKTSVQGSGAKAEIIKAIAELEQLDELDAILLFRGGGSAADLSVFNEYEIARAICSCSLPVISAIGHQEDGSSVQDVSSQSFGVPKDIGRFFADIVSERRNGLQTSAESISHFLQASIQHVESRFSEKATTIRLKSQSILDEFSKHMLRLNSSLTTQSKMVERNARSSFLATASPISALAKQIVRQQQHQVAAFQLVFERWSDRLIGESEKYLKSMETIFQGISPEVQLRRGFALVRLQGEDKPIVKGSELSSGMKIQIEFQDQSKIAEIVGTKE